MARSTKVYVGAVNIAAHPHKGPQTYVDLFRDLYGINKGVKLRGNEWAKFGSMFPINEDDFQDGFHGYIYRYTQIDPDGKWLNTLSGKILAAEEAKKEVIVPDHMKPNLRLIRYAFFPKLHRLAFTTRYRGNSISPELIAKFIASLASHKEITGGKRVINITVEQSRETVDYILKNLSLQKLVITVKRPNPDDDGAEDDDTAAVLEDQHAERQVVELDAIKGMSLKPNERNQKLARLATSNGSVFARGIEKKTGKRKQVDSESFPLIEDDVLPDKVDFIPWFLSLARKVVEKAKGNI